MQDKVRSYSYSYCCNVFAMNMYSFINSIFAQVAYFGSDDQLLAVRLDQNPSDNQTQIVPLSTQPTNCEKFPSLIYYRELLNA